MTVGADRDGLEEISCAPPREGAKKKRIYLDGFHPICHQGAISQRLTGPAVSSRLGSRLSRRRTLTSKQAPLMIPRAAALAAEFRSEFWTLLSVQASVERRLCLCEEAGKSEGRSLRRHADRVVVGGVLGR